MATHFSTVQTGKAVKEELVLINWINNKLKNREWENHGVSETKYTISFVPLFKRKYMNKKEFAKKLGVSYGVLRKFLSEQKVKHIVENHLSEYAQFFGDVTTKQIAKEIIEIEEGEKPKEGEVSKRDMIIGEIVQLYSDPLFSEIIKGLKINPFTPTNTKDELSILAVYYQTLDEAALIAKKHDKGHYLLIRTMLSSCVLEAIGVILERAKDNYEKTQKIELDSFNDLIGMVKQLQEYSHENLEVIRKANIY